MYDGESTGSTEAYGHFTLIHIEVPTRHSIGYDLGVPEDQQGPIVEIPAGWYMVQTYDSGRVDYVQYDSEADAKVDWETADEEYSAWLDDEEPEPLAANAGSFD
jgi:hypothetical protein